MLEIVVLVWPAGSSVSGSRSIASRTLVIFATWVGASVGGAGTGVGVAVGGAARHADARDVSVARPSRRSASRLVTSAIVNFACSNACSNSIRKDLGRPRRAWGPGPRRINLAVYRSAPGPRSDLAPGVRRLAADRADRAATRPDHRHDGPHHPNLAAFGAGHRSDRQRTARRTRAQLQRVRHSPGGPLQSTARHRPRDRT